MFETPQGRLRGFTLEFCESMFGVVGAHVKNVELSFESADSELVHLTVLAVELEVANTVLEVGVPDEHVLLQVEDLQVPVVLSAGQRAVFLRLAVAQRNCPCVGDVLALCGFQFDDWVLLADVEQFDTAVTTGSGDFVVAKSDFAPDPVDGVDHLLVHFGLAFRH